MKKKKIIMSLATLLLVTTITTGCGKSVEVKNGAMVAVSTSEQQLNIIIK